MSNKKLIKILFSRFFFVPLHRDKEIRCLTYKRNKDNEKCL